MLRQATRMCIAIGVCACAFGVNLTAQSTATSREQRRFEIISVDGNKVVVRGERGTQEITVPDDFQLTVDGKPVTVRDLKPGMKGTATITTTTTVKPVTSRRCATAKSCRRRAPRSSSADRRVSGCSRRATWTSVASRS